jgi:Fur family transcriptional regulator, ferric uptake regulator
MERKEGATVVAEKIYAAFDAASQRNTRPRQIIAERLIEFAKSGTDFTIYGLWQELRTVEPRLGRATVFRWIEKLVTMGILERVEFADGMHHYHVGGETHHHYLTCTHCRRVVELDVCLPVDQFQEISNQTEFTIEGHTLTIFGRCKECRIRERVFS